MNLATSYDLHFLGTCKNQLIVQVIIKSTKHKRYFNSMFTNETEYQIYVVGSVWPRKQVRNAKSGRAV